MNLSETYDLITTNGMYIGVWTYCNYFINLYLLDVDFYELWYFSPDNKIEKLRD